ncbi:amidase [Rhizobium sp. Root1204]|uniref:amidase n=1 Tax=Rhizobium sp. Root1204 TaxID=1736428 RepID=UPI00138F74E0|nr:amidase [Rhizobium sp. Root1204]
MTTDPCRLSIADAGEALRAGTLTSVALTESCLSQVRLWEPVVKAFITLTEDRALSDARRADEQLSVGIDLGPLHGIPVGIKDIFDTRGVRTTCGSRLLLDNVPDTDSTVGSRLALAGGVFLGKTNTYEFAIGDRADDLPFPPSMNPWKLDRITPGSSSGSAVGIATSMMRLATATDTGGSIRLPAACCGIVGLKPTFGRVSRQGVFPFSHSCDHAGLLTATVEDMAVGMQVIAGYDPQDPASADKPVPDYRHALDLGVVDLKIGVDMRFVEHGAVSDTMQEEFARVLQLLQNSGAQIVDISLPRYDAFAACGSAVIGVEGLSVHHRTLQTQPEMLSRALRHGFIPAIAVSALDYVQAQKLRRDLAMDINAALTDVDVMLCLVTTGGALRYDPVPDSTMFGRTIPFNITGHPAMSVPTNADHDGLPLGVQVVGKPFDEAMVLRVGKVIEARAGWLGRAPAFPPCP